MSGSGKLVVLFIVVNIILTTAPTHRRYTEPSKYFARTSTD